MNFSGHARAGLAAGAVFSVASLVYLKEFDRSALIGLLMFAGAVFPDLDTDSIPSRWAARTGLAGSLIMLYLDRPFVPALAGMLFFLVKSGKHRGFIHKYWLPGLCFLLTARTGNLFYAAFGAGLVVHLGLDKINPLKLKNWF